MEQHILGATRYERATACFYYHPDSELSELVENLKYRSMPGLAEEMGRIMGRNIFGSGYFSDIDCVMPIPMHWHKKLHRGYNQAGQLAIGVAEILKKPVFANLRARRMHRTQTGVSRSRRYRNVSGIFRIYRPEELSGYHVLLVDDICTTGSTLASACQELVETVVDVKVSFYTLGFTI